MMQRIERVDTIPLILSLLMEMGLNEAIDRVYKAHKNWQGLTYGKLALLFVTYVIHSLTHSLSGMENWLAQHKTVLEKLTGWELNENDATDDRLGRLLEVLGENEEKSVDFQVQIGQQIIRGYELPTEIGRYDTTSFNVYHSIENRDKGILQFGYSKDNHPDLLQFKQGLGTIDPAGIPLMTDTISGEKADDRCYVPAWKRMVKTIGKADFLFIADCKAGSTETRATIAEKQGYYLFPLPMTGDVPNILKELVLNPPEKPEKILLNPKTVEKDEKPREVGIGFIVKKQMEAMTEEGTVYKWEERWIFSQSDTHASSQRKSITERLLKAEKKLNALKPKKNENADTFLKRAETVLKDCKVADLITLKVEESFNYEKKYTKKGRPTPDTSYEMIEIREIKISFQHNDKAIEECLSLAGWRIYVTNTSSDKLSLNQATQYYRDEWLVERGFHRFKNGCLPALPLFLRLQERIKGLMMLLMVALQVLTLIEFVSHRSLEKENESIAGLVPGNPKMKTKSPTAERLLSQITGIHLLITETDTQIKGSVVETLNPLQCRILSLLNLPMSLYNITFSIEKIKNSV